MSFALVFSFHRQQWAAVMEQLRDYIPRIDNHDDDDSPSATENWDDECNQYADFLDHRRMWSAVITELGMILPLARVEKEMSLARLDKESLARLSRTDRRWIWEAVMGEMIQAVKARNTRRGQRQTKLIDRRGRSLPRLHFN